MLSINHLKVLSPAMCLEVSEEALNAVTETTGFRMSSSYSYANCMGLGGSNAAVISFGGSSEQAHTTRPPARQTNVTFWPGGGGELESAESATLFDEYHIVGSWTDWSHPQPMEAETDDTYGYTVTLGEKGWEEFAIWIEGDARRVLQPAQCNALKNSAAHGPSEDSWGTSWRIDARPALAGSFDAPWEWQEDEDWGEHCAQYEEQDSMADTGGEPGDKYRVRLRIAGKWRI